MWAKLSQSNTLKLITFGMFLPYASFGVTYHTTLGVQFNVLHKFSFKIIKSDEVLVNIFSSIIWSESVNVMIGLSFNKGIKKTNSGAFGKIINKVQKILVIGRGNIRKKATQLTINMLQRDLCMPMATFVKTIRGRLRTNLCLHNCCCEL